MSSQPPPPPPPPPPPAAPPPMPPPGTPPPPMSPMQPAGLGASVDPPNAVLMLVLSIVGLVICGPAALVGMIMAHGAMKQYPNSGMTKAAFWVGLVAVGLWVIGFLIWGAIFVIAAASGGLQH